MAGFDTKLAGAWVRLHGAFNERRSRNVCHGLYDGDRLGAFGRADGKVPVLFAIPAMSDVNGALPHPGVRVLQTVLRHHGIRCEVLNYNLPVLNPRDPFDHLIRAIRELGVRVLGVSTYSQAIGNTLDGLRRVKQACPELTIVLGGPHPTESYVSLLGVSFVDYVCRGEAEESFPLLVTSLLAGRRPEGGEIPGVYHYSRENNRVEGVPASFVDLAKFDRDKLLRYHFSTDELKQQRLFRGCHGTAGAEYWPVALVRGCPYDCTFCAAYQMSGKKLRYRSTAAVVDDLEFYLHEYGRRHFSFIDDAFTQHYDYVIELCREIVRRGLKVYWTTDNGIRYETLGEGKLLNSFLQKHGLASVDELLRLMMRAGWRGTAIGIESGSLRVRRDLVRKGGALLSNEQILHNLHVLKQAARSERVYFYINGFMMAGFPALPLPNGKLVERETEAEMEQTRLFALELRDRGAIDMMNLSMVIPLPATDMWECMTIRDKLHILLRCVPDDSPHAPAIREARDEVLRRHPDPEATRYRTEPEAEFWKAIYRLPDAAQMLAMEAYDAFNADAAHTIELDRSDREFLQEYREQVVSEFYGKLSMKFRMVKHVFHRSSSLEDVAAYLTLLGRKYDPNQKARPQDD